MKHVTHVTRQSSPQGHYCNIVGGDRLARATDKLINILCHMVFDLVIVQTKQAIKNFEHSFFYNSITDTQVNHCYIQFLIRNSSGTMYIKDITYCDFLYQFRRIVVKVSKGAKIRSRYNQVPHPTQDTNGKVTNSQLDTTNESQEVSPFPAGDHKAHINRRAQRHSKHKTEQKHKRSTKEVPP